jgi:hypothetical protein
VVGTYTYDVFGAIRSETGGQSNDCRFTGQRCDLACHARAATTPRGPPGLTLSSATPTD